MEGYLNKYFGIRSKNASEEDLEGWKMRCGLVKNPKRRFRYTANLGKRREARTVRLNFWEKRQKAILISKKLYHLLHDYVIKEYEASKEVKQAGFKIDAEKLSSLVCARKMDDLKAFFGAGGLARLLSVSLDNGISGIERPPLPVRQSIFGSNRFFEMPCNSFWIHVLGALHDPSLISLMVFTLVFIVIGNATEGWPKSMRDGLGMVLYILLEALIMASSTHKLERLLQKLYKKRKENTIFVTRDGCRKKISVRDLLVGDIVHLRSGVQVPADGIYISGYDLRIDESYLTGEGEPVNINDDNPFLLKGMKVQDGSAKMLVTSVGRRTYWGRLMALVSKSVEKGISLKEAFCYFAIFVGVIGFIFSLLALLVVHARVTVRRALPYDFLGWSTSNALELLKYFAVPVTVLVVGVPESITLGTSLILSFTMRKLMKERFLLEHFSSFKSMASIDSICINKTVIVTTNHVAVDRIYTYDEVMLRKDALEILKSSGYERLLDIICQSAFLNTDSGSEVIESAILKFASLLGSDKTNLHQQFEIKQVQPFNSVSKRRKVLVSSSEGRTHAFCTGAAENVLDGCNKIFCGNGESIDLSEKQRQNILNIIHDFCGKALTTVCLAFKEIDDSSNCGIPDDGYTLITIVGISNPVCPEVKDAVKTCLDAGIAVRMVTGDNILTASTIAKECGILTDDNLAIQGPVNLSESSELEHMLPKIQVLANSSPDDKCVFVTKLKGKFQEVVAVTGDGISDAPALHSADVGLVMRIYKAKVANDMPNVGLMNDNFTTMVNLLKLGTLVLRSHQQFMEIWLTINFVALVFNFVSVCISESAALTAIQLLWINTMSGILGALVLITEPMHNISMARAPVGKKLNSITKAMLLNVIRQSIYQLALLFFLVFHGTWLLRHSGKDAGSILNMVIFNSFALCQVFNQIASKGFEKINVFRGTRNSWLFVIIIVCILLLQILYMELVVLFSRPRPLSRQLLETNMLVGLGSMAIAVLVKCIKTLYVAAIDHSPGCVDYANRGEEHPEKGKGQMKQSRKKKETKEKKM